MDHGHPIRVVAKRTGMSHHLIRIWERRYAAVNPRRTDTGRRLYSDNDIERLILLRRATMEGQTISQIAKLTDKQLKDLIPANTEFSKDDISITTNLSIEQYLNLSFKMIKNLDAAGLERQLLRASVNLGQQVFIENLLHPLMELTGDMWEDGRLKVAHEHLASAVVRSLLGSMYLSESSNQPAPLLISTTPQGQLHEFGALMALVTAASIGWKTLYLGPNLPAEDIVAAAKNRHADAIALSIVYPPDDPYLVSELRKIHNLTSGSIPLLVGGRAAQSYGRVINEINAISITGLTDLKEKLNKVRK